MILQKQNAYFISFSCNLSISRHPLLYLSDPRKGKFILTSNLNEYEGIDSLGHSNWTICCPFSPFYSNNFATFSLSYWEANSYYPRGPIMGKGDSPNLIKGKDKSHVRHNFKVDTSPPKGQAAQLLGKFPFRSYVQ